MPPNIDSPLRGIVMILAATTIFSIADTIAKFLTAELAAVQINWTRYLVSTCMALAISLRSPGHPIRSTPVHSSTRGTRSLAPPWRAIGRPRHRSPPPTACRWPDRSAGWSPG